MAAARTSIQKVPVMLYKAERSTGCSAKNGEHDVRGQYLRLAHAKKRSQRRRNPGVYGA